MENNRIDFNHWLGSEIGNQILSNEQNKKYLQFIYYLKPKFGKDGNEFYYILGNIQDKDCIIGFGETPYKAMINFCICFESIK